ncbi:glycosyltransferase family 2 protein, partial [Geodermatophilus sp. CPCC 206100]
MREVKSSVIDVRPSAEVVQHPRAHTGPVRTTAPRVSVVVPTFNEAKNLPHVFALIPEDVHEVIVVDGR